MADVEPGDLREVKSFCRICTGLCGTIVTLDRDDRIVATRGDKDDPQTLGFVCSKGSNAPDFHNSADRLLHPLKRMPDGSFQKIALQDALAEIGDKLAEIYERDGPEAIASFRGSGGFFYAVTLNLLTDWLAALGSGKNYSTLTIDQSAKTIVMSRLGYWAAGKHRVQFSDVAFLIGANPLVSITQLDCRNPVKRLKEHKARGMKLIVMDPRHTETARHADLFVQPLPGQDGPIVAAVLRTILEEGWYDKAFCDEHVADLDLLRAAVAPFDAVSVAHRADIPVEQIRQIAEMFARDNKKGIASSGTGPDMGPHSNVTEHLIECLNVVCGRYTREGEEITNAGFLFPTGSLPAQVVRLPRTWDMGPRNRINGYGPVCGEMQTSAMADDILQPGPGQVKFLFNLGGNPATCVPDQRKMVQALRSLELFVSIEPFMTPTAHLSHYILPPRMFYERADLPMHIFEQVLYPRPYTRYTPSLTNPPAGSDVCTEFDVFWHLAKRLGKTIHFHGIPLDMEQMPTEDEMLAIVAHKALAPWDEIKQETLGCFRDPGTVALACDPKTADRFTTMPDDVQEELKALLDDVPTFGAFKSNGRTFGFLMSSRRQRHRFNSIGFKITELQRAMPSNLGYMNPEDMETIGIRDGDWIQIESDTGAIQVVAQSDASVRKAVISVCHGFGGLPDEDTYFDGGVSTNQLISTDRDLQTINGTPRMSGIPVDITLSNGPAEANCRADKRQPVVVA
ncbi:molybdopterin-containing oxidoreductase family protein [Sphingobium baderi]|uniref:4Fe-4S Mo/W bis-MGD-type domain-containing protein n=1 Tax=Sphingobium baderi TaxID=1332080 RepID=A0A0S3F0F1_9SPHN|nr:molybdopterin-dependent oxidoreductase [Sphingobium baderi]ALR21158.1 hypothetical protein ATN00_13505 [Sphingobium baderi]